MNKYFIWGIFVISMLFFAAGAGAQKSESDALIEALREYGMKEPQTEEPTTNVATEKEVEAASTPTPNPEKIMKLVETLKTEASAINDQQYDRILQSLYQILGSTAPSANTARIENSLKVLANPPTPLPKTHSTSTVTPTPQPDSADPDTQSTLPQVTPLKTQNRLSSDVQSQTQPNESTLSSHQEAPDAANDVIITPPSPTAPARIQPKTDQVDKPARINYETELRLLNPMLLQEAILRIEHDREQFSPALREEIFSILYKLRTLTDQLRGLLKTATSDTHNED